MNSNLQEDMDNPWVMCDLCETMIRFNDYNTHTNMCMQGRTSIFQSLQPISESENPWRRIPSSTNLTDDDDDENREYDNNETTEPQPFNTMVSPFQTIQELFDTSILRTFNHTDEESEQTPLLDVFSQIVNTNNENQQPSPLLNIFSQMVNTNNNDENQQPSPLLNIFSQLADNMQQTRDENNEQAESRITMEINFEEIPLNNIRDNEDNVDEETGHEEEEGEHEDDESLSRRYEDYINTRATDLNTLTNQMTQPLTRISFDIPTTSLNSIIPQNLVLQLSQLSRILPQRNMNDYDFNLMLANLIGKIEKGIEDLDKVSTVLTAEQEKEKSNEMCPICQETISNIKEEDSNHNIRITSPCNHIFCENCLSTWLKKNITCPVCILELDQGVQVSN